MNRSVDEKNHSHYHHGNLKLALVDAYTELLATMSPDKLSLRKLAKHVGVAPTAVYNHFKDKDALTAAVRARCLRHFGDFLAAHYDEGLSPEKNISLIGKTYYRYSQIHADYFRIIFQSPTAEVYVTEELIAAGMHAEERLRKTVITLLEHYDIPATQYNEGLGAFTCWSMAHGVTTLASLHVNRVACSGDRWPPEFMLNNEQSVDQVFDAMSNIIIAGILATLKPPKDTAHGS